MHLFSSFSTTIYIYTYVDNDDSSHSGDNNSGAVIGGTIGGTVAVIIIVITVIVICYLGFRKRKGKSSRETTIQMCVQIKYM